MNVWLYLIIGILLVVIIGLILKLALIKKSIKEIRNQTSYILRKDTNNLITISSSDSDVAELTQKLNKELQELRKQKLYYKNGNQELKELMTNVSHDMRTPLTAIKGYVELINKTQDAEKQKKYLKIIEKKINELTVLTEQIFEFSKIVDRNQKIKKEKYCINDILEELLASYYTILNTKKIIPKIEICDKKVYRKIDINIITRVFDNILSNAIKYSDGDLEIKLEENGKITFSNIAKTLDEVTVKKMFNRYYTVENAKKSTGLGLSIAKQLIETCNEKISAKYVNGRLIIEIEL